MAADDDEDFVATRVNDDDVDESDFAATQFMGEEDDLASTQFLDGDDATSPLAGAHSDEVTRLNPSQLTPAQLTPAQPTPGIPDFAETFRMESPEEAALADRPPEVAIQAAIQQSLSERPAAAARPETLPGMRPRPVVRATPHATVPPLAATQRGGHTVGVVVVTVVVIGAVLVAIALLVL
jgi:hypothetical protein